MLDFESLLHYQLLKLEYELAIVLSVRLDLQILITPLVSSNSSFYILLLALLVKRNLSS
jgi:hypothetical protein